MIKTKKEIRLIKDSCKIVAEVLLHLRDYIKAGAVTKDIDRIAEDYILSNKGIPAFKGYQVQKIKFPASVCISINEEVVHGIPSDRILKDGDIVSVDVGVLKNGYYGDAAYTYEVGEINAKKKKLVSVTEKSLYLGIEKALDGNEVNDIGSTIQNYVESYGFGVVRVLCGHGIGKKLHEEPSIPNYYNRNYRQKLYNGMVIAIEPMINYKTPDVKWHDDGWTVVTSDGEPSAHFEHTVLITKNGPEILSKV